MHALLPASSWTGSEVSRGDFLQDGIVQRLVGYELLEAAVLTLQFLESLGLVGAKSSVVLPSAVVRLLGNLNCLAGRRDALALGK